MAQTFMALLYLMRHGPDEGGADPPLSPDGERLILGAALGLARMGVAFDGIYCSRLRRASRTAELMARHAGRGGPSAWGVAEEAGPGARLKPLAAFLGARHGALDTVLAVGHQPEMARMVMEAIGARLPVPLGQGWVCGVEAPDWTALADGRPATLRLLAPAALLAAAAGS
jgi:phosphohistidine phosphatase SixA